ncbi:hypothetical protein [Methanosarcina horonobensis]
MAAAGLLMGAGFIRKRNI